MLFRLGIALLLIPFAALADSVVPVDKVENHVNVRLDADASSEIVGRLKQGDRLPLVSQTDGWYEVALEGGATGFISADWTRIEKEPLAEVADEAGVETESTVETDEMVEPLTDAVAATVDEPTEAVPEDAEVLADVEAAPEVEETEVPPEPEPEEIIVSEPEAQPDVDAAEPPPVASTPSGKPVIKGKADFLVRFKNEVEGESSQIFDDGNRIGIGTRDPQQRLEVNGSIQIHEQNSSVAGLMITQSRGETGYILHNQASTLTIGAGSQDRITIDRDGNVGIAVARPNHPLELQSGAHVTRGGVWTNRSSRDSKQNILPLQEDAAVAALMALDPVTFEYRNDDPETYVGFIAEDVPSLVAMQDRQSLSPMDVIAVLTRVVQQQQIKINELESRIDAGQ